MGANQTFGSYLATARRAAKLSLRQLAGQLRKKEGGTLSPQYLNDIERDRRNPPDSFILEQLATVLHLDLGVLESLAGHEAAEVQEYLRGNPEARNAVGKLFRKAKEEGFSNWERLVARLNVNEEEE